MTLRLDYDVLDFFHADGRGWQERISAALRKLAGKQKRGKAVRMIQY